MDRGGQTDRNLLSGQNRQTVMVMVIVGQEAGWRRHAYHCDSGVRGAWKTDRQPPSEHACEGVVIDSATHFSLLASSLLLTPPLPPYRHVRLSLTGIFGALPFPHLPPPPTQ